MKPSRERTRKRFSTSIASTSLQNKVSVRPEAGGLRQRQPQVGHLQEIRLRSANRIVERRVYINVADVELGHVAFSHH